MSDEFIKDQEQIVDRFDEHQFHNTYQGDCSTCFKENRLIKAKRTISWGDLYQDGRNESAL